MKLVETVKSSCETGKKGKFKLLLPLFYFSEVKYFICTFYLFYLILKCSPTFNERTVYISATINIVKKFLNCTEFI